MRGSTLAALLGLVLLWSTAFPVIKMGLDGMTAGDLTLLRHLVASACFLPFLLLTRSRLWPRKGDLLGLFGLGVVGITIYHLGLNYGEVHVSAGATSLIVAAGPALTALVAWWLAGDRLPALGWVGTAIAFSGVALISVADGGETGFHPAALLTFLAPLTAALMAVLQRPYLQRYRPLEVTAFLTWGGTLPLLVFLPGTLGHLPQIPPAALWAAAYLGLVPSAIAYTLFAVALSRISAPMVMSFLYLIPVSSLLLSWWWLGETPSWLMLAGGAVVVVGLLLIQRSKRAAQARAVETATS